jgi:hypothetical protein
MDAYPDPDPADPTPGLTQIEQSEITHGKQLKKFGDLKLPAKGICGTSACV